MICSKSKLDPELDKIRSILLENGYPEHAINSAFKQKLQQLNSNPVHIVEECPVYLHILWIGNVSMKFEKQITSAVKRCFFSVEPRVILTPDSSYQQLRKTCYLPIITAMLFTSLCSTSIVGTLIACLNAEKSELNNTFQDPLSILLPGTTAKAFPALSRTTYAHNNFTNPPLVNIFLTTPNALFTTTMKIFFILARGRSSFHLSALEATFIKSLNPLMCKQKQFVYSLKIS